MSEYISREIKPLKDAEKYLCSYIKLCDELLKNPSIKNIKAQKKVISTFNKILNDQRNAKEDLLYKQNNIQAIIFHIRNIVEKKLNVVRKEIVILETSQKSGDKVRLLDIIRNTEIA